MSISSSRLASAGFVLFAAALVAQLGVASCTPSDVCLRKSDCAAGYRCSDGRCVVDVDDVAPDPVDGAAPEVAGLDARADADAGDVGRTDARDSGPADATDAATSDDTGDDTGDETALDDTGADDTGADDTDADDTGADDTADDADGGLDASFP